MSTDLDNHLLAYTGDNIYDFDNKILLNWYSKRILEISKKTSLLELGLGHGFTTLNFSKKCKRHVVLDGSSKIIENFKKKYPENNTEIIETYFEDFDTNERFDVIVMGFILEHVDNPKLLINKYKKFLNENGRLFISVPNAEVMNRRLGNLSGMLDNIEELSEHDSLLGHKRYYTHKTLIEELTSENLEILRVEGIYLKPFTTKQMLSLELNDEVINSLCLLGKEYPELSCGILVEVKDKK